MFLGGPSCSFIAICRAHYIENVESEALVELSLDMIK